MRFKVDENIALEIGELPYEGRHDDRRGSPKAMKAKEPRRCGQSSLLSEAPLSLGRLAHLALIVVFLGTSVWADSWGPPTPEHWSANGKYVLKVRWGSDEPERLSLLHKTDNGLVEMWSRGYVDADWPPHTAYVTNDGRHVVLRDVHSRLGYGKVLVFLGPKGNVIRGYELKDILTDHEIMRAKHTVSSIWWSEPGWFSLMDGDRQFAFITQQKTIRGYDVRTGKRVRTDQKLRSRLLAAATADMMRLLSDPRPRTREYGATMLGALGARQSIPALKQLLPDWSVTATAGRGVWGKPYQFRGVQIAAAGALLKILGAEAIPLIEEQILSAGPDMQIELMEELARLDRPNGWEVVESPHTAAANVAWERLARHDRKAVRAFALAQRLARDDMTYLRSNPQLLGSWDRNVRYWAIRCMAAHGTAQDVPLFGRALRDLDPINRLWALRGLIRVKPANLNETLASAKLDSDHSVRLEAKLALARQGDKDALRYAAKKLKGLGRTHLGDAEALCQLAADLKLEQAKAPLRKALARGGVPVSVAGALAVLGDVDALARLRTLAREGHALDRADAIRWLGRAGDEESREFLKAALDDEEPWVRQAAKEAIEKLGPGGDPPDTQRQ